MANKKDFAVGTIANAPGTAGTSLVLDAGYGAVMPTPPFYLTLSPAGQMTTLANSEKVLVTARPGNADTFTIVRGQSPTTAKNVAVGWIAVNGVYVDDIENISMITGETPGGTVNGSNTAFTTASTYMTGSLRVFKNGIRLKGAGNDYTETAGGFTMVTAPATGTLLVVDYTTSMTGVYSQGSNSTITDEVPAGLVNGTNAVFTTARAYIAGTLAVYVNGLRQAKTTHVTETSPSAGTFTLDTAPATGDVVVVTYQYNLNPASNADTVDGIHANTTPTAGNLVPLDGSGKYGSNVLKPGTINYLDPGSGSTANFSTSSTAYVETGPSVTYTSGSTAEKLFLQTKFMAISTGAGSTNIFATLRVDSTDLTTQEQFFTVNTTQWVPVSIPFVVDVAANTTITLKLAIKVTSGSGAIGRDNTAAGYRTRIQGFAVSQ